MRQYRLRRSQRGAIGILSAVTLVLVIVMLALVIDSSRLYLAKRNVQRIADLAALEAASRGGVCTPAGQMTSAQAQQAAVQSATRNQFNPSLPKHTLTSKIGVIVQDATGRRRLSETIPAGQPTDGVEVNVSHRVASSIVANLASLIPGSSMASEVDIRASATAQRMAQASLSVGSGLLNLQSGTSPLLNPIINGLLNGNVDLGVLTPAGVAAANVELLSFLELLRVRANVATLEQVLKADIGVLPFVSVLGELINQKASVNTKLNQASFLNVGAVGVTLGQLLGVETGTSREALKTNINLVELLKVGAFAANGERAIDLNVDLLKLPNISKLISDNRGNITVPGGIVAYPTGTTKPLASAKLQVTELPQFAYGPPGKDSTGKWLTQAKTGQLNLTLVLNDEPLGILNIGGLLKVKLDLAVHIGLAKGEAALKSISCSNPGEIVVAASSSTDQITISGANRNDPAHISVTIAGLNLVNLKVVVDHQLLGTDSKELKFSYNPLTGAISPAKQSISSSVNLQLPKLKVLSYEETYDRVEECNVPLLGFVLCPINEIIVKILHWTVSNLFNLLGGLTDVLNLILSAVSKLLLDPILRLLGITLGYAEVSVHGVSQIPAQLVR